jgi:DNA invertase Pin-like site-specific DNA recombinase
MGHAGIVLGLEVSRLARNNSDWHRLLEICAMSGTLILDEDGLYDPCDFNDRLVRHEVLCDRVEVKDHHRRAVAAAG